jgi:hypothetical protein
MQIIPENYHRVEQKPRKRRLATGTLKSPHKKERVSSRRLLLWVLGISFWTNYLSGFSLLDSWP